MLPENQAILKDPNQVHQKMENYNQFGHSSSKKGQTFQQMSLKKGQAKGDFSDFKIKPLFFQENPVAAPR